MSSGRRIFCSFSGGETSAEMTLRVQRALRPDDTMIVGFSNTGEEAEPTLAFVDRCDRAFGWNVVWIEGVVNQRHRAATKHRVVTFETATRGKNLFEEMIRKYGIPNKNYPHCTRELKLRPMNSYLASIGWAEGTYATAIGIRSDELDRIDPHAKEKGFIYPLAQAGIEKIDVQRAWDARPFKLGLKEHEGNCRWCWKKSLRKHLTLITEQPSTFDTPRYFEATYSYAGAGVGPRSFFRGNRSTDDLFALAAQPFEPFVDRRGQPDGNLYFGPPPDVELDFGESCSESCEPFGAEDSPVLEEAA